jgi:hypothetical protein
VPTWAARDDTGHAHWWNLTPLRSAPDRTREHDLAVDHGEHHRDRGEVVGIAVDRILDQRGEVRAEAGR